MFRDLRGKAWLGMILVGLVLLPASRTLAQGRVRVEAYAGEPFGVGHVEIELPPSQLPQPLGLVGLGVSDRNGRVFYPTVENHPLAGVVRDLAGQVPGTVGQLLGGVLANREGRTNLYFLFTGRAPVELIVQAQQAIPLTVVPRGDLGGYRRTFATWWRFYSATPGILQRRTDYPPLVDSYLRAMLARRFALTLPQRSRTDPWQEQFARELGLAAGTESLRVAMERDRFLASPSPAETADQALPAPVDSTGADVPESPADVKIEPLAMHVPQQWLYVRFGSFANFLWMQDTLERWGGDFQNLVASRGLDRGTRRRFETQLVMQTTAIARLLGDTVIADVAIVGADMFLQEGAAYGLVFQARNNLILSNNFASQRAERLKKGGLIEKKFKIADRDVSWLSSSDGSVRSFYVSRGDYHLVTSSQAMVRQFLAVKAGQGSLGESKEFRYARSIMPLARNDTVLVYLSAAFFRNLVSPGYRIEMLRRVQAMADIDLANLAMRASAAERKPDGDFAQLVAGGFLPPDYGARADGSRTVIISGEPRDSLRGKFGVFVPIPDLEVSQASRSELAAYGQFAQFYQSQCGHLDPILIGVQRKTLAADRERITLDLRMSPLAKRNYEKLREMVGPPDPQRIAPIASDSLAFEVQLPQQKLFGGVQFLAANGDLIQSTALPLLRFRDFLVGYLGTTGELGVLNFLTRPMTPAWDPNGLVPVDIGLQRVQAGPFTLFSFHRETLEAVAPQLRLEPAARPAQFRIRAVDLSDARMAPALNQWGYQRTRQTSLGNLRLLHAVTQQFHVAGPEAKAAAEVLLNAQLICPLGGQYFYRTTPDGAGYWTSTAIEAERNAEGGIRMPEGYRAPPLEWFRGLNMDATLEPTVLQGHVEVDMQWPAKK